MSDLEFRSNHNFFRVLISSIEKEKITNTDTFALYIQHLFIEITPPLGLLGLIVN